MSFEHIIRSHGDDLYRLAVLLTPDPAAAKALVQRVARGFRERDPASALEVAHALFEHAHERRRLLRRNAVSAWATAPTVNPAQAPILIAIARMPVAQRLALGMAALHAFDAENRSLHTIAGREWRTLVRDALLSLLPVVDPEIDRSVFEPDQAPEECRVARAALTLDPAVTYVSSEVRGHLALCETCRQAVRDWRRLAVQVEESLRDALRPIRLPEDVAAQAIAAARSDTRSPARRMLESHWWRYALLPLTVAFLIALMVWPRGDDEETPVLTGSAYSLRELVERAEQTLYTPSPGEGAWQGRYLIRWTFVDQTYANLRGDLWIDRETGQHRIQLVHQQGGAPYEFQLADRRGQASYAVVPAYSATLGLPFEGEESRGIQVNADADMRQRLLLARLNTGAWATPRLYLAQARTAELQSWGRRRLDDGTQVEVIGFRGVSLLGFPPDAPGAGDSSAAILLAIDGVTGSLREIRELIGPTEGEQVSRTVWTFDGGREVDPREEARIFSIAFAWNGRGTFVRQETIVSPYLPLIPAESIIPLEQAMREMIALPDPPLDTVEAILTRDIPMVGGEMGNADDWYVAIYVGSGRRLIIRAPLIANTQALEAFASADVEQIRVGPYEVWLRPGVRWNYQAVVIDALSPLWGHVAHIEAQGYTRAEVLEALASLGVMTPQRYEEQRAFFAASAARATRR